MSEPEQPTPPEQIQQPQQPQNQGQGHTDSEVPSKKPSWSEPEMQIIYSCCKEVPQPDLDTILAKLQESGYTRTKIQLEAILQKSKEQEQPSPSAPAEQSQSEPAKQSRPTAARAKKFIGGCAATLSGKEDWSRKKKQSSVEEDTNRKKKSEQTKPSAPLFKSKRKVKPQEPVQYPQYSNPEERFLALQQTYWDCQSFINKRAKKSQNPSGQQVRNQSWIEHQYFYSNYDIPYFFFNDFQQFFRAANIQNEQKYSDNQLIRKAMGKPRLFSQNFIQHQRSLLQNCRHLARTLNNDNLNELADQLPNRRAAETFKKINRLGVGQTVIALHPVCGHLHIGSILALYKDNQIIVKFRNPELGVQKVLDKNISSEYNLKRDPGRQGFQSPNQDVFNYKNNEYIENVDYYATAFAIQALQYKNDLIAELKQNNNLLEQMKSKGLPITEQFQQRYGWINSIINIVNFCLRHIMTRFRLRGTASYNLEEVSKNMPKLLANPLSSMEKDLEDDTESLKKIRQIVANQQEVTGQFLLKKKINSSVEELSRKFNPDGRQIQHEDLVKNFLSVLTTLKVDGKITNIAENKFVKAMAEQLYKTHTEQFSEITDLLHALSSK